MGTRIKKFIIIILLLLFVGGCGKFKSAEPIDYYNEIKSQFGERSLIRKETYSTYYVRDEDGKFWIVALKYNNSVEGLQVYISDKELIFTQE